MKPFDLEAAKRGEPMEVADDETWKPVTFVGVLSGGKIATEEVGRQILHLAVPEFYRMAPKKVTWYCCHYIHNDEPRLRRSLHPIELTEELRWLGVPFTIEVEE